MARVDVLSALARTPLFRGCSPGDFAALLPAVRSQILEKGHYLFHTGDPASSMYVVLSGQVNVSRLGPNGEEFVVDVFLPDDTFGELSIFDDGLVRIVECLAAERTVCLALGRQPLLAFLEQNHHVVVRVLAALARRVRDRDLLMSETGFQNIAGRVACKLIVLADTHGEPLADGVRISAQLSQATLANMVGASRENVNRALSRLVRLGDIRRSGSTIIIPKVDALRARYSWLVP